MGRNRKSRLIGIALRNFTKKPARTSANIAEIESQIRWQTLYFDWILLRRNLINLINLQRFEEENWKYLWIVVIQRYAGQNF